MLRINWIQQSSYVNGKEQIDKSIYTSGNDKCYKEKKDNIREQKVKGCA